MNRAEVVRRPGDDRSDHKRPVARYAARRPRQPAFQRVNSITIYTAHISTERKILGSKKIDVPVRGLRDDAARDQAQRHEGKAEQQRAIADLVNDLESGQAQ